VGRESETIALKRAGQGAGKTIMRGWIAETKLRIGRFNEGQKAAVKTILAANDRVIGALPRAAPVGRSRARPAMTTASGHRADAPRRCHSRRPRRCHSIHAMTSLRR